MAGSDGGAGDDEEYVYRISTAQEWEELQKSGFISGGEMDRSAGFIHLSKLDQVQFVLQNFLLNTKFELYLLQVDAKQLGDGLVYERVDDSNVFPHSSVFPHFYGPSRSFAPLPLTAVKKAEKITISDGNFICSLFD